MKKSLVLSSQKKAKSIQVHQGALPSAVIHPMDVLAATAIPGRLADVLALPMKDAAAPHTRGNEAGLDPLMNAENDAPV